MDQVLPLVAAHGARNVAAHDVNALYRLRAVPKHAYTVARRPALPLHAKDVRGLAAADPALAETVVARLGAASRAALESVDGALA